MEFAPFIGIFLAVAAIPILVVEFVLAGLRRVCGPTSYAVVAGVCRGLTYSPCMLGGGCGGAMVPLFVGLIVGAVQEDYVVDAWRGVPFVLITAISFLCSSLIQERQRVKGKSDPKDQSQETPTKTPASSTEPEGRRP